MADRGLGIGESVLMSLSGIILVFTILAVLAAATLLVMPENRVVFGVLALVGASMLLLIPLDGFLRKIPPQAGLAGAFGLFFLLRNVNAGCLGFEGLRFFPLPAWLYQ